MLASLYLSLSYLLWHYWDCNVRWWWSCWANHHISIDRFGSWTPSGTEWTVNNCSRRHQTQTFSGCYRNRPPSVNACLLPPPASTRQLRQRPYITSPPAPPPLPPSITQCNNRPWPRIRRRQGWEQHRCIPSPSPSSHSRQPRRLESVYPNNHFHIQRRLCSFKNKNVLISCKNPPYLPHPPSWFTSLFTLFLGTKSLPENPSARVLYDEEREDWAPSFRSYLSCLY